MQLFEREEALAALAGLRDAAFAGRGGIALVTGPMAVGKSALLDVFADQAAEAGALTLSCVAAQDESNLRLGVLSQFAHCAAMPAADRAFIRNLTAEAVREPAIDCAEYARITNVLCGHLIELSVRVPLAIVVDDVQYADQASLAGLGFLVRRVRDARIVLALGHGDRGDLPCRDLLVDVQRRPFSRTITLQPLSRAGVKGMLADRLGAEPAGHVTDACLAATGGNPLLIGGLLDDLSLESATTPGAEPATHPTAEHELALGDGYTFAVLATLRRGGPDVWTAAEGVAIADGECAARLLGPDATPAVAALVRSGLVVNQRFRHPAARSAVLGAMGRDRRAVLHSRAAEMAFGDGRPVAEAADHLLAAGRAPAPWAVDALAEAARLALADKRAGVSIDYLRLAADECQDEVQRARLVTALVRAEWRRNPALPLPRLDGLVADMRAGHLVGADAAVLVRTLLWHGRDTEARAVLALLADGRAASDGESAAESAAELRLTWQWLRFVYPSLLDLLPNSGSAPREPAVGAAAQAGRRHDAAVVLQSAVTLDPSGELADEAERILRISGLDVLGTSGVEFALLALIHAEMPHRAAQWCDKLIAEAADHQAPARRARLTAIRGEIALREGQLPDAEEYARDALLALPPAGWGVAVGGPLSTLLTALAAMGRLAEAAIVLRRPVPETMLRSTFGLAYLRARGRVGLARGDFDGALADFLVCQDLSQRWNLDGPGATRWRTDIAEAWLALGKPGRARPFLEEELTRCSERARPRAHGNALRLMAHCSEPRERHVLLGRAVATLAEAGDAYGLAVALTELTMALSDMGYTFRATVTGRRAWHIAAGCRAEPLLEVLAPYSGSSEPENAVATLSEAEQRVAELAVQGLTNRQIANRLYITVSTVEQHLTRIYRKLGVTSRSALAIVQSAQ